MIENKTKACRVLTRVYTAQVKLNTKDKFKKHIILENENGTLFIDRELFCFSFLPGQTITATVKDKIPLNPILL